MPITETREVDILQDNWVEINKKYSPWLHNLARSKYSLSSADADNLVQEVWTRVWSFRQRQEKLRPNQAWFKFNPDPEKASFRPFLVVNLRWAAQDRFRKTKQLQSLADGSQPPVSGQDGDEEEFLQLLENPDKLQALLGELWGKFDATEAQQFRIIQLDLQNEESQNKKSQKEIAQEVGCSEATVSNAIRRFERTMCQYFELRGE